MSDPLLRLVLELSDEALVEPLSALLERVGAQGVEIQDAHTLPSTQDVAPPPPGGARLVTYLVEPTEAELTRLRDGAAEVAGWFNAHVEVRQAPFTDTGWRHAWRAFFKPAQVSPRLAIRPPWAELTLDEAVEVLVIEPGMAFGTGLHETTRLCLQAIDRLTTDADAGPTRALDVGCGSGVLAIAAARLGVPQVTGIDVDPAAVEASVANAVVNGVEAQTHFSATPLGALPGRYPLVIANILGHILRGLRDDLIAHLEPGAALLLSGLLAEEAEALTAHFTASGALSLVDTHALGEWVALTLRREG